MCVKQDQYMWKGLFRKRPKYVKRALHCEFAPRLCVKQDLNKWKTDYSERDPNMSKEAYIVNFTCVSNRTYICEKRTIQKETQICQKTTLWISYVKYVSNRTYICGKRTIQKETQICQKRPTLWISYVCQTGTIYVHNRLFRKRHKYVKRDLHCKFHMRVKQDLYMWKTDYSKRPIEKCLCNEKRLDQKKSKKIEKK